MNPLVNFVVHKLLNPRKKWYPFISVFYLTYECNFRCPFCSDGSGTPYYRLPEKILPASEVIKLLKIIRTKCDYIVLTGGEPLRHPEFSSIMEAVVQMKFREVVLTTNGYDVDKHFSAIAGAVTSLVFSLNSLDPERSDRFFGLKSHDKGATLRKILGNIDLAEKHSNKNFQIHISSVVGPSNIEDLYKVYEFARKRDFIFAACPQLVGVKPHSGLSGKDDFRAFYTFLLEEKQKGNKVYGTTPYLEYMRDLRKFRCYPFTMLVVSPTGDVYYPCLEIGHLAGNLLKTQNLHKIRQNGERLFGPQPDCDNRCQSACALGFSMLFQHPSVIFEDIWFTARRFLHRLHD
ncbi:MAG: radical SAM protein [Candidatus Riflebacteria bacterium]|nr:radical SAM protein [Candidatus Riflebacteria bacterium]